MLSSVSNTQTHSLHSAAYRLARSSHQDPQNSATAQTPELKNTSPQSSNEKLSVEQIQELTKLKARDLEVKAHEQAHLSAAGNIALSGAAFTYQQGPDGKSYAIGGEVNIDTSAIAGDPEATLRKAETIQRAAVAPTQPSGQDHKVAAAAAKMAAKAQYELLLQNQYSQTSGNKSAESRLGSNINYSV